MCLAGATQLRSIRISGPASSLCGPQGTRKVTLSRGRHATVDQTSAAHRSAAMAGGARPDPFRTRKLSRRAPMVLRGKPVGEQGAADRWTALDPFSRARARGRRGGGSPRGAPFLITQSCFRGPPYFLCNGRCGGLFLCSPSSGPCAPSAPSSRDGAARCPAAFPLAGISPPWPSRGRDAKPLSRQALLIGELGAARRSAGCRGGTAANGRCLRAGGPSPAVRDTCPIAPRRSPRRCPARLFCRRIWAVCDSRPECPGLRAPPPIRRHGQWAPPAWRRPLARPGLGAVPGFPVPVEWFPWAAGGEGRDGSSRSRRR